MSSLTEPDASAPSTERWSVPRAAALVTLASGVLWMAIVAIASWLIA